jgi:hypothetical protein
MPPVRRPHASIRLGLTYQDIVGVGYLLEMLQQRAERILWVEFERDDAGSLDDVVVRYDSRLHCLQVKYAVDAGQQWSYDDLCQATRGRPLLGR